ncbi:MAG: mco 1 [Bacilli bacterium]|nr:mco 1 [Bacilli bacterium]
MKKILKALKVILVSLGAIIVMGSGTFYIMAKNSAQPASMNMGSMSSMNMGSDDHSKMSNSKAQNEIPMSTLVEKPSDAPVKTFEITAEDKKIDTGRGRIVDAWTYNGTLPGPEIRVQQGDRVIVHLKNRLTEGVTIHWHGVELPNAEDGVAGLTQDSVPPGGEFTYDFIAKLPGTYWYHSHQESNKETTKGLYGTLIVEPKQSTVHYDKDYTAVLHDWDHDINTVNGTSNGEHFNA